MEILRSNYLRSSPPLKTKRETNIIKRGDIMINKTYQTEIVLTKINTLLSDNKTNKAFNLLLEEGYFSTTELVIPKGSFNLIDHLPTISGFTKQSSLERMLTLISLIGNEYSPIHSNLTLIPLLGDNYRKVVNHLIEHNVIEIYTENGIESYNTEVHSKLYRLVKPFSSIKQIYKLTNVDLINKRNLITYKNMLKDIKSPLFIFDIHNYFVSSRYFNMKQAKEAWKVKVTNKDTDKDGKKYKFLGSNPQRRNDYNNVYFEDAWYKYLSLTDMKRGSRETAGNRYYCPENLMSSVFRKAMTIQNESATEIDYTCLHPNLAISIYSPLNSGKTVSHEMIAKYLGLTKSEVKIKHLTFFNSRLDHMKLSPLWKYYTEEHPEMMKNLIVDKEEEMTRKIYGGNKHFKTEQITSKKLFTLETAIMTEVVTKCINSGIYGRYIFDAIGCKVSDSNKVREIMNDTIAQFNVNTVAI